MSWLARVKRRRAGIYAYRTRKHLRPFRKEWGYVGESWNLAMRDRCHAGTCGRHATCQEKPWYDLVAKRYSIQLPWWLSWKWVIRSLETVAIWVLRPRYNIAKNPWPHVDKPKQARQRWDREMQPQSYRALVEMARWVDWVYRAAGIAAIALGIGGYLWTK